MKFIIGVLALMAMFSTASDSVYGSSGSGDSVYGSSTFGSLFGSEHATYFVDQYNHYGSEGSGNHVHMENYNHEDTSNVDVQEATAMCYDLPNSVFEPDNPFQSCHEMAGILGCEMSLGEDVMIKDFCCESCKTPPLCMDWDQVLARVEAYEMDTCSDFAMKGYCSKLPEPDTFDFAQVCCDTCSRTPKDECIDENASLCAQQEVFWGAEDCGGESAGIEYFPIHLNECVNESEEEYYQLLCEREGVIVEHMYSDSMCTEMLEAESSTYVYDTCVEDYGDRRLRRNLLGLKSLEFRVGQDEDERRSAMLQIKWTGACVPMSSDCVCAGVVNESGDGGANCNSIYNGQSYCYVEKNTCSDAQQSNQLPDYEWSIKACEVIDDMSGSQGSYGSYGSLGYVHGSDSFTYGSSGSGSSSYGSSDGTYMRDEFSEGHGGSTSVNNVDHEDTSTVPEDPVMCFELPVEYFEPDNPFQSCQEFVGFVGCDYQIDLGDGTTMNVSSVCCETCKNPPPICADWDDVMARLSDVGASNCQEFAEEGWCTKQMQPGAPDFVQVCCETCSQAPRDGCGELGPDYVCASQEVFWGADNCSGQSPGTEYFPVKLGGCEPEHHDDGEISYDKVMCVSPGVIANIEYLDSECTILLSDDHTPEHYVHGTCVRDDDYDYGSVGSHSDSEVDVGDISYSRIGRRKLSDEDHVDHAMVRISWTGGCHPDDEPEEPHHPAHQGPVRKVRWSNPMPWLNIDYHAGTAVRAESSVGVVNTSEESNHYYAFAGVVFIAGLVMVYMYYNYRKRKTLEESMERLLEQIEEEI